MTIILDAMGSDSYPDPEIQAAVAAAEELNIEIILVGNKEIIEPKLKALTLIISPSQSNMRLMSWKWPIKS